MQLYIYREATLRKNRLNIKKKTYLHIQVVGLRTKLYKVILPICKVNVPTCLHAYKVYSIIRKHLTSILNVSNESPVIRVPLKMSINGNKYHEYKYIGLVRTT